VPAAAGEGRKHKPAIQAGRTSPYAASRRLSTTETLKKGVPEARLFSNHGRKPVERKQTKNILPFLRWSPVGAIEPFQAPLRGLETATKGKAWCLVPSSHGFAPVAREQYAPSGAAGKSWRTRSALDMDYCFFAVPPIPAVLCVLRGLPILRKGPSGLR